ncbi:hypothetical protein STENM327S_01139 [Streptomyces tendae]
MGVVVAQVVGGDDAQAVQQRPGQAQVGGDRLPVLGQQPGQHVLALRTAEPYAGLPGEVVESHVVQVDVGGCHPEQRGELALEPDRHVAQPDRAVPGPEQGPGDDADRVGEVDDPGVRVGPAHPLGDVEHHRHRAQRLGEAARAGRLLADAAALQRPGLVLLPGGLAADAQLEQDRVGTVDGRVQVGGGDHAAVVPLLGEDAPGEAAHQLQPVRRRVDEDQLLDGQRVPQPGEAVDQFGRVGRTAADHGEFHADINPLLQSA